MYLLSSSSRDLGGCAKSSLQLWTSRQRDLLRKGSVNSATTTLCGLDGSFFTPDACVDCHHFVHLQLITCFKVSITALGLSSQIHPLALHMLSSITSYRKCKPIFPLFSCLFCRFSRNSQTMPLLCFHFAK